MDKKYKVLFHLDAAKEEKHISILRNIENVIADLGEKSIEVELVVHGKAMSLFQKTTSQQEKLSELASKGVVLAACQNTMKSMELKKTDLIKEAQVVSSGIGEIVRKQADGWLYIRP